jgi:hypothetical protein
VLHQRSLEFDGDYDLLPKAGYYYSSVAGYHRGWLRGPAAGADFDLYLHRWNGSAWVPVALSAGADADEEVSYRGWPGYYRWQVYSSSGAGGYCFWMQKP